MIDLYDCVNRRMKAGLDDESGERYKILVTVYVQLISK